MCLVSLQRLPWKDWFQRLKTISKTCFSFEIYCCYYYLRIITICMWNKDDCNASYHCSIHLGRTAVEAVQHAAVWREGISYLVWGDVN